MGIPEPTQLSDGRPHRDHCPLVSNGVKVQRLVVLESTHEVGESDARLTGGREYLRNELVVGCRGHSKFLQDIEVEGEVVPE